MRVEILWLFLGFEQENKIQDYLNVANPNYPSLTDLQVAAMIAHNLTHLLTFNTGDFKRFSEITAIAPQDFL